jgi:hypothetical protein
VPAKFTSSTFASPGFSVSGSGQMIVGSNTIGWDGTGLRIGTAGQVGTLSGIAAGGTNYRQGDIVRGPDGGVYEVATVNSGAITALTTLVQPVITSGSAPSNPRTISGGMGSNANINLTWAAAGAVTVAGTLTLGQNGPTIIPGTGAPSAVMPASSIYLRTDGGTGTRLYVSAGGGTWNAVGSV